MTEVVEIVSVVCEQCGETHVKGSKEFDDYVNFIKETDDQFDPDEYVCLACLYEIGKFIDEINKEAIESGELGETELDDEIATWNKKSQQQ